MVAPSVDENLVHAAVAAVLQPALPAGVSVYAHGKVPGTNGSTAPLPQKWVLLTIERRYTETTHVGRTRTAWRAYVRSVADSKHNASDLDTRCSKAIEDLLLTVDGETSTPVAHETSETVRPDDGKFSGLTAWTFTL